MTEPVFLRFTLSLDAGNYDKAAAALLDLPTPGWQEVDEGSTLVFWLAAERAGDPSVQAALAQLRPLGELVAVPERADWLEDWRRFHHPVRVGAVTIRPPWAKPTVDSLDVVIDVGMAFGTGSHATTRQCLLALQEVAPGSLLDLGVGSGVLSLAALRLGFAPVYGCDVDELALRAARKNAALNGLHPQLFVADIADPQVDLPPTEVAVANIALNPIVAYGKRLRAGGKEAATARGKAAVRARERQVPGGGRGESTESKWPASDTSSAPRDVILAGLLVTQAEEARAAFSGYAEHCRAREAEWVMLHLERR